MFDSINEARKAISASRDTLTRKAEDIDNEAFAMMAALQQVLDIVEAADQQAQTLSPDEITDTGE